MPENRDTQNDIYVFSSISALKMVRYNAERSNIQSKIILDVELNVKTSASFRMPVY
jgi:hypothetical protein